MNWRVAETLDVLLARVNQIAPGRDKSSDGSIGDLRHQHESSSDHNPYIVDKGVGVVTARDFTNDPTHGMDSERLAEALRASQDERIKYIISNKKICSGTGQDRPAWQWRPYTGTNPHNHHVHVSVKGSKRYYDDTAPWALNMEATATAAAPAASDPVLRSGDKDVPPADDVTRLQTALNGQGAALRVDGEFGPGTLAAVEVAQRRAGLVVDGVVGKYTWDALKTAPKTKTTTKEKES